MPLALASKHGLRLSRPLVRYSSASFQPSLKLVAELRKNTTASIQKSREALMATHGDLRAAAEWLEKDRAVAGQKKAEKLGGRATGEGLIGISVLSAGTTREEARPLGIRAAMVELNCETDFVGRTELFRNMAQNLAFTAAVLANPPPAPSEEGYADTDFIAALDLASFQDAPLLIRNQSVTKPLNVSEGIRDLIVAVGENITIRRIASFVHQPIPIATGVGLRLAHYAHGSSSTVAPSEAQGRIGTLAALGMVSTRLMALFEDPDFEGGLSKLERALARQIVGMNPASVEDLLSQPFDMLVGSEGKTVESVLKTWSLERNMAEPRDSAPIRPAQFIRWEVGEELPENPL